LIELQSLLHDGNKDIDRDRDPDLSQHSIFGCAIEGFDPEMLLDPFEKQPTCQRQR
jgi:hypothetical protein